MNSNIYIHTPEGPIFSIPKVVLEEIVRVANEQQSVEWPMSCYEDSRRLEQFLKAQK
jgi:hypothetical protein